MLYFAIKDDELTPPRKKNKRVCFVLLSFICNFGGIKQKYGIRIYINNEKN